MSMKASKVVSSDKKSASEEKKRAASAEDDSVLIGDVSKATMKVATIARALGGARGKGPKTFRTVMVQKFSWGPTAANTAYSTVQALTPMGSTEGGNFQAVFDEVKTVGVSVHFTMASQSDGNACSPQPTFGILSYDPSSTTALTSVAGGMEIDQFSGPYQIAPMVNVTATGTSTAAAGYTTISPLPTTRTGMYTKKFRVMGKTVLNPGTSTEIVGGSWVSTQDSNQIVGYLKPYFEAAGAHNETLAFVFVMYHVIFRSRH